MIDCVACDAIIITRSVMEMKMIRETIKMNCKEAFGVSDKFKLQSVNLIVKKIL